MHGLVETITAGGLEAGFLELLDGVSLGFQETFAAGVAAFEGIVGEEFDVRPPGVAVEVGNGESLLGRGSGGQGKEKNQTQSVAHGFTPRERNERLEDSRDQEEESRESAMERFDFPPSYLKARRRSASR